MASNLELGLAAGIAAPPGPGNCAHQGPVMAWTAGWPVFNFDRIGVTPAAGPNAPSLASTASVEPRPRVMLWDVQA